MEVSIIGLGPTKKQARGEKWGLPWDADWGAYDRLFEMHHMSLIENIPCRPDGYIDRLCSVWVPLYMQEQYFPHVTVYPFEDVSKTTDYWNSSIAYMMALAIHEGYDRINVVGVDMKAEDEYFYQRPNMEYLIGLARGKGIEVNIPKESPLCKFSPNGIKYGNQYVNYNGRYGWL